ncbi:hypothetical protein JYT83_00990 [bacterium AH-315-F18]|nr:hypothetical protein [bacterium AH-315-F18]
MSEDDWPTSFGKLSGNIRSLEFALRAYIGNTTRVPTDPTIHYENMNVGDVVTLDAFTNYDSLGQLIDKYNDHVATIEPKYIISGDVVDIRDALAHGRIAAATPTSDLLLLKFSRPKKGDTTVTVTHAQRVSKAWLATKIKETHDTLMNVVQANQLITK